MSSNFLSRVKNRLKAVIPDKRVEREQFAELRDLVLGTKIDVKLRMDEVNARLDELSKQSDVVKTIASHNFDHIFELRRDLLKFRQTSEYEKLFNEVHPLVSVRIATWNNPELLIERAIKSVLKQSYDNWEIIVVGDCCDDDTENRVKSLNDSRISFYNMPHRGVYPKDRLKRWQVAGSPGMNRGAELARGQWIAPLDDDDEFSEDHIEVLLEKALSGRFECVYGNIEQVFLPENTRKVIGTYPPEEGEISSQAFIYPKLLNFFEWETQSWKVNEPGDWNLIRRMLEAGVLFGKVDKTVSTIYRLPPGSK